MWTVFGGFSIKIGINMFLAGFSLTVVDRGHYTEVIVNTGLTVYGGITSKEFLIRKRERWKEEREREIMGSTLSRLSRHKLLFHTLCRLKLICLWASISFWNQFSLYPKVIPLSGFPVHCIIVFLQPDIVIICHLLFVLLFVICYCYCIIVIVICYLLFVIVIVIVIVTVLLFVVFVYSRINDSIRLWRC